jgi:hypothetical protein
MRVFENGMQRKVFGFKGDEVTREWRRLLDEGVYDSYSSPNIIRVIKSGRITRAGRVAHMEERRGAYRVLWRDPRERNH